MMKLRTEVLELFPQLPLLRSKEKRLLSIDISQGAIELVYMEVSADQYQLLAYDIKKIQLEEREDHFIHFIKGFLNRNSIVIKDVILSISNAEAISAKYLALPEMPERELIQAAKLKLKEEIPFELENASVDWRIIKERVEQGSNNKGYIFIIASREVIDKHLSVIKKCHLNPTRIVSGAFNYANTLKYLPENPPSAAILEIDDKDSTLGIYVNGQLVFTRRLSISWEKLTQSLMETLISDRGKMELSEDEAEEVKSEFGIPQNESEVFRGTIKATMIISMIRPILEALVRELNFSFNYFKSDLEAENPTHLYLTGVGANLKNLESYLSKELKMSVSYLSLPSNVDTSALSGNSLHIHEQAKIISAVGATMDVSRSINLLPKEIKVQHRQQSWLMFLRPAGIAVGAFLAIFILMTNREINDYEKRIHIANQHLETIQKIEILNEKILIRERLIKRIQKGKVPIFGVLKMVSALMPDKAILDDLTFSQKNSTLKLGGIVSASQEVAEPILADFMKEIEATSFFREASLLSSRKEGARQKFEIICQY